MFNFILNRPYPFILALRLNDKCNLACKYCDSYLFNKNIDFKLLENFLNNAYAKGCRSIILTGGEPYLYKDIDKLILWLEMHSVYLIINTNGKLIDDTKFQNFLLLADNVLVSIDGKKEITDLNRGNGTYDKAIRTLNFLKKNKIKITLSAVLTNESINEENLNHLTDLKITYNSAIGLSPITEDGRINNTEFSISQKVSLAKLEFLKDYVMARSRHFPEIRSEILNYFINPKPFKCKTYRFALFLDVDNFIYPCINVTGRQDAQVGQLSSLLNFTRSEVNCIKCSCTPLISANLMFGNNKLDLKLVYSIFVRYLPVFSKK